MPLGQIKGKEKTEEELLIREVFGVLKNVDRRTGLGSFLKRVEIDMPEEELEKAEFQFWPSYGFWHNYGDKKLDVVISTNSTLVFVETKLGQTVDIKQLKEEYFAGVNRGPNFYLLCITRDFSEPAPIQALRSQKAVEPEHIKWINWQGIHELIKEIPKLPEIDKVSKRFLNDLAVLLESRGLRGFEGFKREDIERIIDSEAAFKSFYDEITIFISDLTNLLSQSGISSNAERKVLRDGTGYSLDLESWLTTHLTFAYKGDGWVKPNESSPFFLFIRFFLNQPKVWIGYSMTIPNSEAKKILAEKSVEICEFLNASRDLWVVLWNNHWNVSNAMEEVVAAVNVTPKSLRDSTNLEPYYAIEFIEEMPVDQMFSKRFLLEVEKKMLQFRDTVEKLQLVPQGEKTASVEPQPSQLSKEERVYLEDRGPQITGVKEVLQSSSEPFLEKTYEERP